MRLSEAVTGADVAQLAPHDRARMSAQRLSDGTLLNAGGVPRDKPFPAPIDVSKGQGRLD